MVVIVVAVGLGRIQRLFCNKDHYYKQQVPPSA
jgi:hypothetical protein